MPVASYKVTASVILQNQSTKIQNQQLATALRTGLNSFKHLWVVLEGEWKPMGEGIHLSSSDFTLASTL
jgi:hypothetical protein